MITIYKNKTNQKELIEINDLFFDQFTSKLITDDFSEVIFEIDGSKFCNGKLYSKFNNEIIDITCLSSSCKTVLNILCFKDKIFSIKQCGDKAISYIFSLEQGNIYSDYPIIPFEFKSVQIVDGAAIKVIDDYEMLKNWWNDN